MTQSSHEFDGAALELELRARKTPLVRVGPALVKLESLRPSGGADDRALGSWDRALPREAWGTPLAASVSQGAALAAAGWARARGSSIALALHGQATHELFETLKLWGATFARAPSAEEAEQRAQGWAREGRTLLPPLDGDEAARAVQETLGAELLAQLEAEGQQPFALVAPAGARSALLGAYQALRVRWPELDCVALCAESEVEEFPELPPLAQAQRLYRFHPGISLQPLSSTAVRDARASLARGQGISASHAAAAAAIWAELLAVEREAGQAEPRDAVPRVAVALCTALGEREFSLDRMPPTPEDPALAEGELAA